MITKEDINTEDLEFGFTIIDTNDEAHTDPDFDLYGMTDDAFEAHLANLAAEKLATAT